VLYFGVCILVMQMPGVSLRLLSNKSLFIKKSSELCVDRVECAHRRRRAAHDEAPDLPPVHHLIARSLAEPAVTTVLEGANGA
jgi:hypothetical protein